MPTSIPRISGRATMNKVRRVFITSLALAITLATTQTFGASTGSPGASSTSTHSGVAVARSPHHNGRNIRTFFPTNGTWFWPGPTDSREPSITVTEPITSGPSFNCTLDVPGDWAHRCPPSLFASPPDPPPPPLIPYEPGCPAKAVTVPGADGRDQTITIVRC